MLRGGTHLEQEPRPWEEIPYPAFDQPIELQPSPPGILFYNRKECFFFAYPFLQSMLLSDQALSLAFSGGTVVIEGRGLHTLLHYLAQQKVSAIFEQGDRYATLSDQPVHVSRLERIS